MSEKKHLDNGYIQISPPNKEKLAEYLKQAKGENRTMAQFAEVCKLDGKPVSPSTFSRIIKGKIIKPLSFELVKTIIDNAKDPESISLDEFMLANGMMSRSEWERNSFRTRSEERRKNFDAIRHIIADELYSRGCMLRMCPGIPRNEIPESRFFLPWRSRLAVTVQDFEPKFWNFIHVHIYDYSDDISDEDKRIGYNMRDIIDSLSYLFLRDMWEPETIEDVKHSFVFTEKQYYDLFCELMAKIKVNTYMSVILIDIDEKTVVAEEMVPRYDEKEAVRIFERERISGF